MVEFRKLIEFGKSSYIVSLPKSWVEENKLKKGDILSIEETGEGLTISPKEVKEQKHVTRSIKIDVSNMSMKEIKSQIICNYVQNLNEIILQGSNIKDNLAEIREFIHNLIALEVMEESSKRIVAKDFLNMREILIPDLIRKMDIITKEIIADSKKARTEDVYTSIAIRDQDVNKIAYLVFRTIKYLQNNPSIAKEQGMTPEKILKSWIVAYCIEKVGDQAKRISKLMKDVKRLDEKGWKEISTLYSRIDDLYRDTVKAYYTNDAKAAYELGTRKSRLLKDCRSCYEKYWKIQWMPAILEKFEFMIGFAQPISKTVIT
jgi:phosphate transport system protein